jgi:hypothetical protein
MKPALYAFSLLFLLGPGCAQKPPLPATPIYDEKADAHRDIAAAIAKVQGSQRHVVLIFGANW